MHPVRNSGRMAALSKQEMALYIVVFFCFVASMGTVLCESGSQSTPINYRPIPNRTPPCGNTSQKTCVTQRPPANVQRRPCNPSDRCRSGQKPAVSQSNVLVSAATKQFGLQDHSFFHWVLQWIAGWVLFLYFKL